MKLPTALRWPLLAGLIIGSHPLLTVGAESWSMRERTLHRMDLDGGLSLDIPLWSYESWAGPPIRLVLRHEIMVGPDGYAESQFCIPQLQSYVTPAGQDRWVWCKPGGLKLTFAFKPGQATAEQGNYVLMQGAAGKFSVTARNGARYDYDNGRWTGFRSRAGDVLSISANGGLVHNICETTHGRIRNLVSVVYEMGRPTALRFEDGRSLVFEYSGPRNAQLARVAGDDGALVCRLGYSSSLLTSVEYADGRVSRFAWTSFAAFRRSDHRARLPVYLSSDEVYSYRYRQEDIWTIITAQSPTSANEELRYNRLARRVERSRP